ncbi:MAG TPA: SRPBCC domain-containing protein [Solirubrobacteraceae bacterium]|nr:SRPBCC domain-containing protein [Solirubrobacteraceae bacterium]
MARNTVRIDAPPESVWEVLADPRLYGNWVVGASATYEVEGTWPEVGSVLHHSQMMVIRDVTIVRESEPARRLLLEARARPLIVAMVAVTLEPDGDGTLLLLDEWASGGLAAAAPRAVTDALIHVRNREAVKRLKRLVDIGRQLGRA